MKYTMATVRTLALQKMCTIVVLTSLCMTSPSPIFSGNGSSDSAINTNTSFFDESADDTTSATVQKASNATQTIRDLLTCNDQLRHQKLFLTRNLTRQQKCSSVGETIDLIEKIEGLTIIIQSNNELIKSLADEHGIDAREILDKRSKKNDRSHKKNRRALRSYATLAVHDSELFDY